MGEEIFPGSFRGASRKCRKNNEKKRNVRRTRTCRMSKRGWVGKDKVRTLTLIEEEERQERNEKDGKVQNRKKRVILPERFWGSLWNVDAVGGDRSPTAQERGGNLIYGQQQTL
jgi:hypothetical protein